MDLNEETQKLGGNALFRYALVLLGLLLFLLSQGILTWKSTSARDASGKVEAVQFEIAMLEKDIEESESSDDKKKMREEIDDLRKDDLKKARMEAAEESVDAKTGIWFWSMARLKAVGIMCLGFLVIAAVGSSHEKIGALVAFALLVTKL
ncbi:hypothetical protein JO972_11800 [Verrucomicrobiaceae bacterium 5K15]|uniref:Uncharacterized protein n=1 Tax=Oceaniferula flava TaxID=2800421 RepID=A0AAE2SCF6_9BACT|nr:hypothetical protein [Oceaniferula flavus]MBK1855646.1 hypothetical protein [Oceaniferula flavus]MBM1136952.1 hypothetical protein [Oceaniferula flavus]